MAEKTYGGGLLLNKALFMIQALKSLVFCHKIKSKDRYSNIIAHANLKTLYKIFC